MYKNVLYQEGDWFAIPLRTGGYATGVIARSNGKGILLGYFFGPRLENQPNKEDVNNLTAEKAILIRQFGDLGFIQSKWFIVSHSERWSRIEWPLPAFARINKSENSFWRVEYSENDLGIVLQEIKISLEESSFLPEDGLSGYGALEIRLTKLLSAPTFIFQEGNLE